MFNSITYFLTGAFAVQRSYREDFEHCLFFLDRILCFLPELIKQRWQCNAFTHIFKKLLHMNNTIRLKREASGLDSAIVEILKYDDDSIMNWLLTIFYRRAEQGDVSYIYKYGE